MLELRPNCECCDKDLPPASPEALICTFECTWCAACAEHCLGGRCPNCGGDLQRRPLRPSRHLDRHPASRSRVHQPGLHRPAATPLPASLAERFDALVLSELMGGDRGLGEAVRLAEDLVAAGLGGPATLAAASLSRDATRRDAEEVLFEMFREFSVVLPDEHDEAGRYALLLRYFASGAASFPAFHGAFWSRLPELADQSTLDRRLAPLMDHYDAHSTPAARNRLVDDMRRVVAEALSTERADPRGHGAR